MTRFWSERTRKIQPYVPGEQPLDKKYIKLNTNENPYPPSPAVKEAIVSNVSELSLYPDPACTALKELIAQKESLNIEEVFIGNGSDEVLAFSFMAFFDPDSTILFPEITYSFYPVYSSLFNINYNLISVKDDFTFHRSDFFQENDGIIFPNPNAPTGIYLTLDNIEKILARNRGSLVIVDEAYIDFADDHSAVDLIKNYDNLLVVRTFSKSRSLAGLRVGYALGQPSLIEGLDRIKNSINSYTIDRLALAGAQAALRDEDYYKKIISRIIRTRDDTAEKLKECGFKVLPTRSNFLFVSHPDYNAEALFYDLKEKGILLRYFNQDKINNYLRISVGSTEDMSRFLRVIQELLEGF
ncbi:MAG: histidinol-phosphate transaminase [Firmicutes bacterium]|nr:histidinol-phosphate transaminase [Bacillota bacterium]